MPIGIVAEGTEAEAAAREEQWDVMPRCNWLREEIAVGEVDQAVTLADRIVASQVPRDRAVGTASPADPAVAVATGARWSQSGPRPMHHRRAQAMRLLPWTGQRWPFS